MPRKKKDQKKKKNMRYIKEYNEYEGGIGVEDIQDCFRDLIDMGIYVKIAIPAVHTLGFAELSTFDKVFAVSINLDQRTQPFGQNDMSDQKLSEYGVRYRAVIDGKQITELLAESIAKCEGVLDLDIFRAETKWVNAGEWPHLRKLQMKNQGKTEEEIESIVGGTGPGMLDRVYTRDSRKKLADISSIKTTMGLLSTQVNISELEEDIIQKGDRLRNIAIYFVVKR